MTTAVTAGTSLRSAGGGKEGSQGRHDGTDPQCHNPDGEEVKPNSNLGLSTSISNTVRAEASTKRGEANLRM